MNLTKTRVGYLQVPTSSKDVPTVVTDMRTLGLVTPPSAAGESTAGAPERAHASTSDGAVATQQRSPSALESRGKTQIFWRTEALMRAATPRASTELPLRAAASHWSRRNLLLALLALVLPLALLVGQSLLSTTSHAHAARPAQASAPSRHAPPSHSLPSGTKGVSEHASELSATSATLPSSARADARPGGTPAATAPEAPAAPELSATPAEAAHSFSLGEHERALEQYRWLARTQPEQRAYALMVQVLSARQRER